MQNCRKNSMTANEQIELLKLLEHQHKERARNSLDAYCRYIEIPGAPLVEDSCEKGDDCDDPDCTLHEVSSAFYPDTVEPAEHHSLINTTLEKVESREIDPETGYRYENVMIFMPPGSAKSTYGSVTFPTWYMGKNPNKNIITTSYASQLARKFGRKCRTITASKQFAELFNTGLNPQNRAVDDWALLNGSTFMCGGILSGITGNRADMLVIDDPVKGREDADSPTIRDKTWEAYLSDVKTRLKPNGSQIIIQTRWHEDDLSGRILPKNWDGNSGWVESRQGDMWYVICLQAQCEREDDPLGRKIGEYLWTDWFDAKFWESTKRGQGTRNWDALYQQKPKPVDGALIKRAWPQRYGEPPAEFMRVVFSLDTAYKEDQINDPSVLTIWGEKEHGKYLLHVWRDRVEYPALKRILANHYMAWKPSAVLIEDKSSGQSLIQECRDGILLKQYPKPIHIPVIAIEPEGNKLDRAVRVSSQIEAGIVYLPEVAEWLMDYESELFGFPIATHDDQVDSTTQFLEWSHNSSINLEFISTGKSTTAHQAENTGAFGFRMKSNKYGDF